MIPAGCARAPSSAEALPSISAAIANLLGSPEYFQNRAGSDNAKWINTVYMDLLNRPVDPHPVKKIFPPFFNAATKDE